MGYVYGNLGRVDSSPIGSSSGSSSSGSTSEPKNINEVITTTTIITSSGEKTWKGDPTDTVAIAAWKASYDSGYTTQIISPRDSSGNYTSDTSETVGYTVLSQEQQAKEIAIQLQTEVAVPNSIIQTLQKRLNDTISEITHQNPPTNITDTTRITGDRTITGRDILTDVNKLGAIGIALLIIVLATFKLIKMK